MKIVYQMHITWFETSMAAEVLQSVDNAVKLTDFPVEIVLCFNTQTKYDTPIQGKPEDMFNILMEMDIVKRSKVVWKTDKDSFYNVGDWRRDHYDPKNITIWGESDCLIPLSYFYYVEHTFRTIQTYPFVLTVRQKKMWDSSWQPTEHEAFQQLTLEQVRAINNCFVTGEGLLTYEQLNKFNDSFQNKHTVIRTDLYKGDGALVCISPDMPTPFIDPAIKVFGEDTYFFSYCNIKKIPIYTITNYIKGHNTGHPLKRINHYRTDKQTKEFNEFYTTMQQLTISCINNLK